MILSHKHKFIFFSTPKTGSTSIENALEQYNEDEISFTAKGMFDAKHIPPVYARALLPQSIWEEYFKFSFVRNPYDWFVSQFRYNYPGAKFRISYLMRFPWKTRSYIQTYRYYKLHSSKTKYSAQDVEMLYAFLKGCRGVPSRQSLEQNIYVYDEGENPLLDFVGKFESIEEDVKRIQDQIGLTFDLPHLNKTKRSSFESYLNRDSMTKIEELWSKDFDLLNYKKEFFPSE